MVLRKVRSRKRQLTCSAAARASFSMTEFGFDKRTWTVQLTIEPHCNKSTRDEYHCRTGGRKKIFLFQRRSNTAASFLTGLCMKAAEMDAAMGTSRDLGDGLRF